MVQIPSQWTFGPSIAVASWFLISRIQQDPKTRQKNVHYFRVLSLKLINIYSASEADCFRFRKQHSGSPCSVFLWGPLGDIKLFFPFQSLPWTNSFLFNWFCLLAWFCHSPSSGFSLPPHTTHCFRVDINWHCNMDTSVFCNLCNLRGKNPLFSIL